MLGFQPLTSAPLASFITLTGTLMPDSEWIHVPFEVANVKITADYREITLAGNSSVEELAEYRVLDDKPRLRMP